VVQGVVQILVTVATLCIFVVALAGMTERKERKREASCMEVEDNVSFHCTLTSLPCMFG
jgi:hypothetical protein